MARLPRSSSSRRQLPIWLVLLLAVGGWLYKTFIAPQPSQRTPRTQTSRPPRGSEPRSEPRNNEPVGEIAPPDFNNAPNNLEATVPEGSILTDTVVKVHDGDTVTLKRQGNVRLIGCDTPELSQEGGKTAGAFARQALMGRTVEVQVCGKQPNDRYGRTLGVIWLREGGQRVCFNAEMVRQGYARVYSLKPCSVDEIAWNSLYDEARRERRGLFATLGEVPDAASFRHRKRAQ